MNEYDIFNDSAALCIFLTISFCSKWATVFVSEKSTTMLMKNVKILTICLLLVS